MEPKLVTWRDIEGPPIAVGPTRVTPIMRQHVLRRPWGALLWQRPVALQVVTQGRTYQAPILNVTLRATCAAIAIGALFGMLIGALFNLGRNR
jgi:hypothetical protein